MEPYNTTKVGSVIFYQCQQSGFSPSSVDSVCEANEIWIPDPSQVVCTDQFPIIAGKVRKRMSLCSCAFDSVLLYISHASWEFWIPSAIIFHSSRLLFPL